MERLGFIMNVKRWIAIIAVIVLLFVSVGFRFISSFTSMLLSNTFEVVDEVEEYIIEDGSSTEKIVVLNLEGVIQDLGGGGLFSAGYDHREFLQKIEKAGEDPNVKGLILQVDSPGGGVTESAEIHKKLIELQEEYDIPYYVSMGDMAASGGYYVAAPADKIFALPTTITGSIGVIMESMNFAGLAEDFGITFNTIKSGKHKDIMSANREMTDEEKEILQDIVDEMYDEFVQIIVDGRGMDEAYVRDIADGRIYSGNQAVENELVDEIGDLEEVIEAFKEDYELDQAMVVEYGQYIGGFNMFVSKLDALLSGKEQDISNVIQLIRESDKSRAMYLY